MNAGNVKPTSPAYTPGPWRVYPAGTTVPGYDVCDRIVSDVYHGRVGGMTDADAALIAAVPTLVDALKLAADLLGAPTNRFGKLEFYEDKAREARERLLELHQKYRCEPSSTIPEQASKVLRAIIAAAGVA